MRMGLIIDGMDIRTGEKVVVWKRVIHGWDEMEDTLSKLGSRIQLNHPGWMPISGIYVNENETRLRVVTPVLNGSLENACKQNPDEWTPTKKSICIFGIAAIMAYMHSKDILHCDLRPDNIFLNEKYEPCIGGFYPYNPATVYSPAECMKVMYLGPPVIFAAPDGWDEGYTRKYDVYAYAILLYRMFTHEYVLENGQKLRDLHNIKISILKSISDGKRYMRDPAIPDAIWDLICRCWSQNPADRPSFEEITEELRRSPELWALAGTDLDELIEYQSRILSAKKDAVAECDARVYTVE